MTLRRLHFVHVDIYAAPGVRPQQYINKGMPHEGWEIVDSLFFGAFGYEKEFCSGEKAEEALQEVASFMKVLRARGDIEGAYWRMADRIVDSERAGESGSCVTKYYSEKELEQFEACRGITKNAERFEAEGEYSQAADCYLTIAQMQREGEDSCGVFLTLREAYISMLLVEGYDEAKKRAVVTEIEELIPAVYDEFDLRCKIDVETLETEASILADLILIHLLAGDYETARRELREALEALEVCKRVRTHPGLHSRIFTLSKLLEGDFDNARSRIRLSPYILPSSKVAKALEKLTIKMSEPDNPYSARGK